MVHAPEFIPTTAFWKDPRIPVCMFPVEIAMSNQDETSLKKSRKWVHFSERDSVRYLSHTSFWVNGP
jgi:hypothetical protein